MDDVARKLTASRTRLILDKPFLGALVLRLPLIEAMGSWCATSATDARSIYYNARYIEPLSFSQVQFVLAHEALHCGLSHFARREYRDLNRWNLACDYAVNQLLVEDGLELPPGALHDETYKGLSAEEIYPLIEKDSDEETMDQHLYDAQEDHGQDNQPPQNEPNPDHNQQQNQQQNQTDQNSNQSSEKASQANQSADQEREAFDGSDFNQAQSNNHDKDSGSPIDKGRINHTAGVKPPPLSAQEKDRLNTQWQQRLAGAVQQASAAGKLDGSVARLVERLLHSSVPWRNLLAHYMSGTSRTDYNLMRPSRRRGGQAILPSLHTEQINVCIALDTSGSIEQEEIAEFMAEVNAIKGLVNARIILLACDSKLDDDGPWVYESWEPMEPPKSLKGKGGTDFNPVFDWIKSNAISPDLLIYFTDAVGRFPSHAAHIETLWLVKGGAGVPWGQRVQLN